MDLICFSHLRWDFVYQRPQHLMTRASKGRRVYYIEEPVFNTENPILEIESKGNITVIKPNLPSGLSEQDIVYQQFRLINSFFEKENITDYLFWYYTPMAVAIGNYFSPSIIVYDCMDELSNFKFAPPELRERESDLLSKADIVFTGGHNLYNAKKDSHHNIFPFPSSIDREHFTRARDLISDPDDQHDIPHPKLGFYGVIDERFDIDLIQEVADKRPDWHFIIIGPVVKIDPEALPKRHNIHYLGGKKYDELPAYLAGWDIALIPFLRNDSTKYISPTKTPEYLAAGKPVISTSIIDVINPYGNNNLVHIADTAEEFIKAADTELTNPDRTAWLQQVDVFLAQNSWDKTWSSMNELITKAIKNKLNATETNIVNDLNNKEKIYV